MVKGSFSLYPDKHALDLLGEPMPTGPAPLVQITEREREMVKL